MSLISIGLIVLAFVLVTVIPGRLNITLRPQRAYRQMPRMVGRAVEADRPLHLSFGSAGLGGETTVVAIAASELAYEMARRAAIGDRPPLVTVADTSALPLAQNTLRRAYASRDMLARHKPNAARWYPQGRRSLAFGAALSAMLSDERVGGSVLAGSFGPELGLVMLTSQRMNQPVLAVSDQLEGQAVAYAMGDAPFIGEEVFVSSSYLATEAKGKDKVALTLDLLRYGLIAVMLVGVLLTLGD